MIRYDNSPLIQEPQLKTFIKIVGSVILALAVVLGILRITGLNPHNRTPGLWLSGNLVTTPVTDWSFTSQYQTDKIETHPWYGIAHSVTTGFIVYQGQLYVTSRLEKGQHFPENKGWLKAVMQDPHVRIKFGNNLYRCTLSLVTDPAEKAAIFGPRTHQNPRLLATDTVDGPMSFLFHAQPE